MIRHRLSRLGLMAGLVASVLLLGACQEHAAAQPQAKQTQAQAAEKAANSISFTDNAEIDNIKRRIEPLVVNVQQAAATPK